MKEMIVILAAVLFGKADVPKQNPIPVENGFSIDIDADYHPIYMKEVVVYGDVAKRTQMSAPERKWGCHPWSASDVGGSVQMCEWVNK